MQLNIKLVESFRAIMAAGTVTAAAEMLNTSQPAVSRSLQRLESVVGLRLFGRVKGRLVPTAQGLAFYEEVRKAFIGIDRLSYVAERLRDLKSGTVSIACAPVFSAGFIADALHRFHEHHEDVVVTIDTQLSTTVAEWITAQRFDLGLTAYPMNPQGAASDVFAEPQEICILPTHHPFSAKKVLTPQDLADSRWVFLAGHDPYRYRLDSVFEKAGVVRRLGFETHHSSTLCSLVIRGLGVGIINPFSAVEYLNRGLVMRRFGEDLPFTTTLLRASHRPSSPLVDKLVQELKVTRDKYLAVAEDALS